MKKNLQETYNELQNVCGEVFTSKFPDVFSMNSEDLLEFADSVGKKYGIKDVAAICELLASICEAYDDIKDKPRIWKEETAVVKSVERAKTHRLAR